MEFKDTSTVSKIESKSDSTPARSTVINATTIDVATLTGREGSSDGTTIDKDLTFTDSAEVTTIANKSTELKAKSIDVQALKG